MKCLTKVYGKSSVANPDGKIQKKNKLDIN